MRALLFFLLPLSTFAQIPKVVVRDICESDEVYASVSLFSGQTKVFSDGAQLTDENTRTVKMWYDKLDNKAQFVETTLNVHAKGLNAQSVLNGELFEKKDYLVFRFNADTFIFYKEGEFYATFKRVNNRGDVINNLQISGKSSKKLIKELIEYGKSN